MSRVVIISDELGLYLGSFFGLGFWSNLDTAGQDEVVTFPNEEDARKYVNSWDSVPTSDIRYIEIPTDADYVPLKWFAQ